MISGIERYLYLAAMLVIVTGFFFYRHSLIVEGERICQQREQKASEAQQIKDATSAQKTVGDLNDEIDQLRALAVTPVPGPPVSVRCSVRRVPTGSPTSGTARPGEPATTAGHIPEVSAGAGAGPNIDPKLRRSAFAADLVSARDRACLEWVNRP